MALVEREEPDNGLDGNAVHIVRWPGIQEWFKVLFAHHGQPIAEPPESWATAAFNDPIDYSWKASEPQMGRAMSAWFPESAAAAPPEPVPRLAHHSAGLLALAYWIGSDRGILASCRITTEAIMPGCALARAWLRTIQLDTTLASLRGGADWKLLSDHRQPRPASRSWQKCRWTKPWSSSRPRPARARPRRHCGALPCCIRPGRWTAFTSPSRPGPPHGSGRAG